MNRTQFFHWGLKKKTQQYEETIIEVTTTQPNQSFAWGTVEGDVQYFDWGNGVQNDSESYSFPTAGFHTIKIVGDITHFEINRRRARLVTKIVKVAKTINDFSNTFANTSITDIPVGLFDKNVDVTTFSQCFYECSLLTAIPSDLFKNCISVIDFFGCFSKTGLNSIPSGLFDDCVNSTNFNACFQDTKITSIPNGLFDNCVNADDFLNCFENCRELVSVPENLFDNNIKVSTFKQCFMECRNMTTRPKPHGLELWQLEGQHGRPNSINVIRAYYSCLGLPDYFNIPENIRA